MNYLTFEPWRDDLVEAHGVPVDSVYVERFWTSIIGPTSVSVLRTVVREMHGEPWCVEFDDLAKALGIFGKRVNRSSDSVHRDGGRTALDNTLGRLVHFGLGRMVCEDTYQMRTHLGPLTAYQVERYLPRRLQEAHAELLALVP